MKIAARGAHLNMQQFGFLQHVIAFATITRLQYFPLVDYTYNIFLYSFVDVFLKQHFLFQTPV